MQHMDALKVLDDSDRDTCMAETGGSVLDTRGQRFATHSEMSWESTCWSRRQVFVKRKVWLQRKRCTLKKNKGYKKTGIGEKQVLEEKKGWYNQDR